MLSGYASLRYSDPIQGVGSGANGLSTTPKSKKIPISVDLSSRWSGRRGWTSG